jgi:hypothetical protein
MPTKKRKPPNRTEELAKDIARFGLLAERTFDQVTAIWKSINDERTVAREAKLKEIRAASEAKQKELAEQKIRAEAARPRVWLCIFPNYNAGAYAHAFSTRDLALAAANKEAILDLEDEVR